MRPLLAAAVLAALPAGGSAAADEPPAALFEAAEEAAAVCRELGGTPAIRPGYQTALDLNGDGVEDYLTDQAHLECAGAWSVFCGSAGCPVTAWLSGPAGGHVAFEFGYLQAFEVVAADAVLPAVRAYYHGSACGEGRTGVEGCTRTWVFATNAPETPAIDTPEPAVPAAETPPAPVAETPPTPAAETPVAPAAEAPVVPPAGVDTEPPEPAPAPAPVVEAVAPGWTLRQTPDARLLALGGGIGDIASLAAFCLGEQPFLAVSFIRRPAGETVALDFAFGAGAVSAEAGYEETAGGAYVVALADAPLAGRLAGRDSEVAVAADGRPQGVLSLAGSTRAIRNALGGCYPF